MRTVRIDLLRAHWGTLIRTARLDKELTITGLSRLADMDPGNLSRLERGLQGAADEVRIKLAIALGKRVEELFPYPDTTAPETPERREPEFAGSAG